MRSIQIQYPAGDSGPCVPAALSTLMNLSFDQINNWLVYRGYRDVRGKGGLKSLAVGGTKTYRMNPENIGFERVRDEDVVGISVNQFTLKHSQGSFFVRVNGHALCVINGITYDVQRDPSKKIIKEVWVKRVDRLPYDFEAAQIFAKNRLNSLSKIASNKEVTLKKREIAKKLKEKRKELIKDPTYKLTVLLKRKKQWEKRLKITQTYLKKIERGIKRLEKKINNR